MKNLTIALLFSLVLGCDAPDTDGARDSMSDWIAASTLGANAQLALADATNVARRAAWEASVQQARLAGAQEDRARTAAAWIANEEAKKKNNDRTAKQAELSELMDAKNLSPSEKKRRGELQKELDVPTPKKGKKAKKKDPNKIASDQMDFDADVAVYEAKLAKDLRKENLADQEAAFERESALRERRLSDLDREMELLDARGEAEAERIRDFCEDVPAPGSVGGACFIGYECDAGLTCKVGTIGFVCAETCGSTSGCDCDASCDGGLCAAQCKSSDDCVEGMVCDGYGTGAAICVWPALEPLPSVCPEPIECFSTAASFCTAVDNTADAHGVDQVGRDEVAKKCWGHELPMCDICLLAESVCSASVNGVGCGELASLCMCHGEALPWF